jgi:hypothetical protein
VNAAARLVVAAVTLIAGCTDDAAPTPSRSAAAIEPAQTLAPPPPVAAPPGERWTTFATIAAPSATSALLEHVLRPDNAGTFAAARKCLRAHPPLALTDADLAHLRQVSPRVSGEGACRMGDDGMVRERGTGAQGVYYHVRLLGRSATGSGTFDAGRIYGNLGGDGRTYRVNRTARGWAIAQNQAGWIS